MCNSTAAFFISLGGVVEQPGQWNVPYFNEEGAAIGRPWPSRMPY